MNNICFAKDNNVKRKGDDMMKLKRAEEIFRSNEKIDVFYKNSPVWINSVDPNKDNVDITLLHSNTPMNVPVWDLTE